MRKILSIIPLAILTIGLLCSCSKINERIDGLDKRIYDLENDKIASVEQQITAIKESIADLETIRTNIQALMDAKTAMGEDITKLKAAYQTLESKINDLKTYVDTELAKYATKDWANATFATLSKQAEIITDVEKLKQDLAGLDDKLDQAIANLDSTLKSWVNEQLSGYYTVAEINAKIDDLKSAIDALEGDNETNKDKIEELETSLTQLTQDLATARADIKAAYDIAIKDAIEGNDGYITETIKDAIDEANGKITDLTGRVEDLEDDVTDIWEEIDALKAMIQSMIQTVSIIPAYNNGSVKAEGGILTINCVITPKAAVEALAKENFTILTSESEVLTKSALYGTIDITKDDDLVLDKVNGTATIKVDVSSALPTEEGKALTVAVNIMNGISDFTTEFVPVVVDNTTYSVTFDLNGITGTAPETQKVAKDGKVTKPADPTDANHTFAGWYKTKDATTGALSDLWDFDNGTVTADMTLYAKWTRTLGSIYGTNENVPKSDNNSAPDNAWKNGNDGKAFIAYSGKSSEVLYFYKKLEPSGAKQMSCKKTELFTKIGDDYVFSYGTQYGVFTLHMTGGKFTSVTYDGAGTNYDELSGTYAAPTAN